MSLISLVSLAAPLKTTYVQCQRHFFQWALRTLFIKNIGAAVITFLITSVGGRYSVASWGILFCGSAIFFFLDEILRSIFYVICIAELHKLWRAKPVLARNFSNWTFVGKLAGNKVVCKNVLLSKSEMQGRLRSPNKIIFRGKVLPLQKLALNTAVWCARQCSSVLTQV